MKQKVMISLWNTNGIHTIHEEYPVSEIFKIVVFN